MRYLHCGQNPRTGWRHILGFPWPLASNELFGYRMIIKGRDDHIHCSPILIPSVIFHHVFQEVSWGP